MDRKLIGDTNEAADGHNLKSRYFIAYRYSDVLLPDYSLSAAVIASISLTQTLSLSPLLRSTRGLDGEFTA